MKSHEWRDRDENDEIRLVRAVHHAGDWQIEVRLKTDPAFVRLDPIPLDLLRELRDVLAAKYRRGRVPHEHLVQLEAMVEFAETGKEPPR